MREVLQTRRDAEYFTVDGLRTLTGLNEYQWEDAIFKELLDNALDVLDDFQDKKIVIDLISQDLEADNATLTILDSGGGIPESILERIIDFSVYASDKREYRTPTRGYQGNALKTVIAICYLKGFKLEFIYGDQAYYYAIDKSKLNAGIVISEKHVQPTEVEAGYGGVKITGVNYNLSDLEIWVNKFRACNPAVTFIVNGEVLPSLVNEHEKTNKTFSHWYDLEKFNQLLQAVALKDPQRTVKQFCSIFAGTQRIVSSLSLEHESMKSLADDPEAVKSLLEQLQSLTKPPTPAILKKHLSGREALFKLLGNDAQEADHKYKLILGEFEYEEAVIPYLLEGFLFQTRGEQQEGIKFITAVNNSVPYEEIPFYLNYGKREFCGKHYNVRSIRSLLDSSGLNEARGLVLFINYVSPFISFTDKAKTQIDADYLADDLLKLLTLLCRDTLKEVDRARRERRTFDRENAIKTKPRISKRDYMTYYFKQGYELASGNGQYLTKARQVFYAIREIINRDHGETLNQSDYSTFTQDILTSKFKEDPSLENEILLERRGFFNDPFTGEEMPLGTGDVLNYIANKPVNKIIRQETRMYSLPLNLRFNKVLFIEKQGFNDILTRSGLVDELGLGIISTQGYGTRAAKLLIKYFIENGINVYVLNDCDIAGYLIHDKFASGSGTYEEALSVKHIGLKVEDIHEMGKHETAEIVKYKRPYRNALDLLTKSERQFFVVDHDFYDNNRYRRVEINALSTPELIQYLRDRIPADPIKPTREELINYIDFDEEAIVKEALYQAFKSKVSAINIDQEEIAARVLSELENGHNGEHWTDLLEAVSREFKQKEVARIAENIKISYPKKN